MASLYLLYSLYITPTEGTFSQYMDLFDYSAEIVRRQVDTSNEGNFHPVVIGKNIMFNNGTSICYKIQKEPQRYVDHWII